MITLPSRQAGGGFNVGFWRDSALAIAADTQFFTGDQFNGDIPSGWVLGEFLHQLGFTFDVGFAHVRFHVQCRTNAKGLRFTPVILQMKRMLESGQFSCPVVM